MPGTDLTPQPGNIRGTVGPSGDAVTATIDNRTTLPDNVVREAIMAQWTEATGAMQLAHPTSFQLYANNPGNMLARQPFQTPRNVIEEIRLARSVADTDDDVKATIGSMLSIAFGEGMQNQHPDEKTVQLYNRIARDANLDMQLKEMYREYLIAGSFTTVTLFKRSRLNFNPEGTDQRLAAQLSTPLIGVIPAEDIRVISNDLFGQGELAYLPPDNALKSWLDEYLGERTTAARKNQMRNENPVLAALFVERVEVPWNDTDMFTTGQVVYKLNPRMVSRTSMPHGAGAYARPPLTANFALLEAKRLLNIMDYAILQGGTNYIVVAKQGSDQLPAQQPEIDNLVDQVRQASRSGVMVGDHRLSIEIITPDLKEVLNPTKRKLLGQKIGMALLRIPEQVTDDGGTQGAVNEMEFASRTITADRLDVRRHVERWVYDETADRNPTTFTKGSPKLWFPRIILAGAKDFYDSVKAARDRGDIPRAWSVEVLGFDYDAGVAQRKREKERGDDEVMTPGAVPFSSPGAGPPDAHGRPPGSGPDNGAPGARQADPTPPHQMRPRQAVGEAVIAQYDEERGETVRVGALTVAILEQFPDHQLGRVTDVERQAVNSSSTFQSGALACVPVNVMEPVLDELRAIRLDDGLGMILGQRQSDHAIIAKALTFREPHWNVLQAEDAVLRFGYPLPSRLPEELAAHKKKCKTCGNEIPSYSQLCPNCGSDTSGGSGGDSTEALMKAMVEAMTTAMTAVLENVPVPNITIQMPGEGDVEYVRDPETGALTGKRKLKETSSGE
jgi:hypothetical protein